MLIDWAKVEEITGYTILFVSLVGSHRLGVATEKSDIDYAVYVIQGNPEYHTTRPYRFPEAGEDADIFFRRWGLLELSRAAHLWTVIAYDSVVYAHEKLYNFLKSHTRELSNMSPFDTYMSWRCLADESLRIGNYKKLALIVRESGILYNFLHIGDFHLSMYADDDILSMYRRAKSKDPTITVDSVREFLEPLYSQSTEIFFRNLPTNIDVYNQLYSKIEEIKLLSQI